MHYIRHQDRHTTGKAFCLSLLTLLLFTVAGCTGFVVPPPEGEGALPASSATPSASDSALAMRLTEEGHLNFGQTRFDEAERLFLEALAADPNHVSALLGLSDLYSYQPEKWRQALTLAEHAHQLAGDDPSVLPHLLWAQQMAHQFDDAWNTGRKAVEIAPESYMAHAAYADILISVYENELALHHAEKAVELSPDAALPWVVLSAVREAMHDWPGAEEAITKAVELDPDFLLWTIVQSRLDFDLRGDPELAAELATAVTEALPDHAYVIGLGVDLAIERNDWDTAIAGCERLVTLHSEETRYPDGYTCLATVNMLREDLNQAAEFQTLAESIAWPERFDISLTRMRLHNADEQCEESRALARKWLDARPYSISAQRMLGVGWLCSEDFEQAIERFAIASDKLPYSISDARLLAIAYARNDMESEAVQALERARPFAFDDPLFYQAQYEINFILGDLDAAIENAQRWAVFRPASTDALESIAFAQVYNGDVEAAFRSAQDAYDRGSTTSTTLGILGYVNLLMGEIDLAEDFLRQSVAKDEDMYLVQYSLTQLYQYTDRCEESQPHVDWLTEQFDTAEQRATLDEELQACYDRRTARDAGEMELIPLALAREKVAEALTEQDLTLKLFDILERADQRALVVYYTSTEAPNSMEYQREEIGMGFLLANVLPLLETQPESAILVSGTEEARFAMVVIDAEMAALWLGEHITDEEFTMTWRREDASNMPQDIFEGVE